MPASRVNECVALNPPESLPQGALLRMGFTRLTHANWVTSARHGRCRWSKDGAVVMIDCDDGGLQVLAVKASGAAMNGFHLSWQGLGYNGVGIGWPVVAVVVTVVIGTMLAFVSFAVWLMNRRRDN
jgi:hypothetical protein